MDTLDARLDFRLSAPLKELIQHAAAITGQSVDDFAITVLSEQARKVVQENGMTMLSDRDRDAFLAILDADGEPSEALKRAAERFNRRTK